jgi:hypothetical protein
MKNRITSFLGLALLAAAGSATADTHDANLLAQADGLITHELRIAAEQTVVTRLVEADGLVSLQWLEWVEYDTVARLAMADGLSITPSAPESAPESRSPGAVLLAAKTR